MKRIMIDWEKCEGCLSCALACMDSHRTDGGEAVETLDFKDAATASRNRIAQMPDGSRRPMFCRHCADPKCEASCMSGALIRDASSGHVLYDAQRCGACFMCVMNCPFGIPEPNAARDAILKCDFCKDRSEGPACTAACPTCAIHVEEVDLR